MDPITNSETFNALKEYYLDKLVLFPNSTGTLLKIGNRVYIVTCHHVATEYFSRYRSAAILRENIRIPFCDLRLAGATDDNIDIALIECEKSPPAKDFYSMDALEAIDDRKLSIPLRQIFL